MIPATSHDSGNFKSTITIAGDRMDRLLGVVLCSILLGGCSTAPREPSGNGDSPIETGASVSGDPVSNAASSAGTDGSPALPYILHTEHLPNAVQIHAKVISGGLPSGEAAFAELLRLGVRTVISVDGAKPDIAMAKQHGLRYVHLPHGYDGIPEQRIQELAKAVRDLDGRIYVHCHHGKHRSPAAASVACVAAGLISASQASSVLSIAGTNPNYRGLFQVVERASLIPAARLDRLDGGFPEITAVPPLADAMVQIELSIDRLKLIEQAGWKPLATHPDLVPTHEALILREHFRELLRTDGPNGYATEFRTLLIESEQAAATLETALLEWNSPTTADSSQATRRELPVTIPRNWKVIKDNCVTCHVDFRDNPILER